MRACVGDTIDGLQCGGLASFVTSEGQLIQLSGLTLVSVSGELSVELGLAINTALSPQSSFIGGFDNDNLGYLPARRAYAHCGYKIMGAHKYYGCPAALARKRVSCWSRR